MDFRHDLPLGMQLNTRFAGQVADSPIISNEQFSLGGMESVRGYFETMALADDAVFGSFELYSPHLGSLDWDYLNNLKVLAFVDGAQGWVQNPLPGNVSGYTLAGTGFGMRFQMWKLLSGALDIGIPLFALQVVNRGSPHVHFRVATEF
jgi:hemolysin activation/secretion protein